jgi:periplasmic mercuric ion binding protein
MAILTQHNEETFMKNHILTAAIALTILTTPALAETIHVGVNGMVCAFCAKGIEKSFKAQPETKKVNVSLEDKLITISTKSGKTIKDDKIKKLITDAGYEITTIHRQK